MIPNRHNILYTTFFLTKSSKLLDKKVESESELITVGCFQKYLSIFIFEFLGQDLGSEIGSGLRKFVGRFKHKDASKLVGKDVGKIVGFICHFIMVGSLSLLKDLKQEQLLYIKES